MQAQLRALRDGQNWLGCFGASAVENVHQKYGLLDLAEHIASREERMAFERILALCFTDAAHDISKSGGFSLYGRIHDHRDAFSYYYYSYLRDKSNGDLNGTPCIKVWSGRR
jgi:hypothetical protein